MEIIVILYHGTQERRVRSILSDGSIRRDAKQNHDSNPYGPDTPGYVYLADSVEEAFAFANMAADFDFGERICVFEVDAPEELLEIDADQVEWSARWRESEADSKVVDVDSCLEILHAARIPMDLVIGKHVTRYAFVQRNRDWKEHIENCLEWVDL